jgi:hypothetical protein
MARRERVRHTLQGEFDPAQVQRMTQEGWRPVAIEWERESGGPEQTAIAEATGGEDRLQEVPFGLRVAQDCHHLEEDPAEMHALHTLAELIVQDATLNRMADELNRRGFPMRDGKKWTPVAIYELFPRLIEVAPRIYGDEQWRSRRPNVETVAWNS